VKVSPILSDRVRPRAAAPRRRSLVAALVSLLLSVPCGSAGEAAAADGAARAIDETVDEPQALYAQPSSLDTVGRIVVPGEIDGRGPYRFVLDTGANRSAIAARTALALGLVADPSRPLGVHGVTGSAVLPAVQATSLRVGDIVVHRPRLPVLDDDVFADADGILGIDSLQGARIEVDFTTDRVTIRPSNSKRAKRDYLVVPARLERGGLLLVDGRVGDVKVKVILDTGAERSLGNLALLEALRASTGDEVIGIPTTVTGATPAIAQGHSLEAPAIAIGEATLRNLVVTFGDFHVFRVWQLESEPTLLIGMDLLGFLQGFVVDYRRREFQLLPQQTGKPLTRSCGAGGCRLLIPRNR
jgi:predicted aspartyl protease